MKRCQSRSGVGILEPGQQFEQEHSGCVGDDLIDISELIAMLTTSLTAEAHLPTRWRLNYTEDTIM